jgi:hypothetical protein
MLVLVFLIVVFIGVILLIYSPSIDMVTLNNKKKALILWYTKEKYCRTYKVLFTF